MQKYALQSVIRKKDPYRVFQKAQQESNTAPNRINREFRSLVPYQKLGTDITYIRFLGRWIYLSVVKDMMTGEILAWHLSFHPDVLLVQETLKKLKGNVASMYLLESFVHSDQGFQYTHGSFGETLKKLGCIQSMSRRGNCLDNAPTESFFGHLKDEIDISSYTTFEEVQQYIGEYMHYYNVFRPQWARKKMTPVEYRNHLLKTSQNT